MPLSPASASGYRTVRQRTAPFSQLTLQQHRVQPAAMLETDVLQRADFSKSGAKMQRYRRDVRTVPHNRYHLAVSLRPGPC